MTEKEKEIDLSKASHYAKLDEAWVVLAENREDIDAKAFIVNSYTPLVEHFARKIFKKKPWIFDFEDLKQAGMIGLIQSINKFEPSRGILFSTFAPTRIYGAILDEVNSMDWTPRTVRSKIKDVLLADEKLRKENPQSAPTAAELAKETKLDIEDVYIALKSAPKTHVVAIDNDSVTNIEQMALKHVDFISSSEPKSLQGIEQIVEDSALQQLLIESILKECSEDEIEVLQRHYYKHETLKEIGKKMNFSASKVSHVRNRALEKLAAVIQASDWA